MKTTSYFALAAALLLLALPKVVQAQFTYATTNGTITITGYTGSIANVTIPSAINGVPVTSIGPAAFKYNNSFARVTIPDSVTSIGDFAFEDCSLTSVSIPASVTVIGNSVFSGCGLTSVSIPQGVTTIGAQAFAYCDGLTSVVVPNSVTSIQSYAFWYCSGLKSVTIPNSVTRLDPFVFYECYSLKTVSIPDGIPSIGEWTFYETALTSVTIPNSVTSIGDGAFSGCGSLTDATIPGSVTTIGNEAFAYSALASVTLSNSLTSVGQSAFFDSDLRSVAIPASLTNIQSDAFGSCPYLTNLTVATSNPAYSSLNGVLFDKNQNTLIQFPSGRSGSYTIPDGVTNIGTDAFNSAINLTNVTIPQRVASIGPGAFQGSGLSTVTIPNGVTSLADWTFSDCYSLPGLTIPDSVTTIGVGVFAGAALTSVTIPNSVTTIGDQTFEFCTNLQSVTLPNSVTNLGSAIFESSGLTNLDIPASVISIGDAALTDCSSLSAIHVKTASLFFSSSNGVLFDKNQTILIQFPIGAAATSYAIPPGVTNIGNEAFEEDTNLVNVTLPDGLITIGDDAFFGCAELLSIVISGSVTNVGNEAFGRCINLTSALFEGNAPAGLIAFSWFQDFGFGRDIDPVTFYYLSGATGWDDSAVPLGFPIVMLNGPAHFGATPDGLKYIASASQIFITGYDGSNGFVNIPSAINSVPVVGIGNYAFQNTALTSVTIPADVATLGDWTFANCSNLTSAYFEGNTPNIGPDAFYDADLGYDPVTIYYLPGSLGWSDFSTNTGLPIAQWLLPEPLILPDSGLGVQSGQFGFTISWATNASVVVEACASLANPVWLPVSTNTLVGGSVHFSDPQPANLPGRFYRLRSP